MLFPILAANDPVQAVWQFFYSGGFFMIPLIICSLISMTFILLRAFALRRKLVLPMTLEQEVDRYRPGQSLEPLMRTVQNDDSALANILDAAVHHIDGSKQEATEAVQTRARHEVVRLETGLVVLEVIIGIAPLLGLLGTVSGLVSVFATLGASGETPDPQAIALGISEALNTTIAGLAIAIPSLIGHSYFTKKIEVMSVEMESIVASLLEKLYRAPEAYPEPVYEEPPPPPPAEITPQPRAAATQSMPGGTVQTEGGEAPPPAARTFHPTIGRKPMQVRPKQFTNLPQYTEEEAPQHDPQESLQFEAEEQPADPDEPRRD